jgi:acyl-CoA synthetase (AMP-forming)/AMP-acid ligase II
MRLARSTSRRFASACALSSAYFRTAACPYFRAAWLDAFRPTGFEETMQLTRPLHQALTEWPQRTALVDGGRRVAYGELAARVARLAALLREQGVCAGDRVALLGMNSARYVEAIYAVWWAGGVVNPVNIRWTVSEMAWSLDDCETRWLIVDQAFASQVPALREKSRCLAEVLYFGDGAASSDVVDVEAALVGRAPVEDAARHGDDLAALMYTGGTTGKPKGVMLSHANLFLGTLSASGSVHREAGAVALTCAPLFHVGAVGHLLQLVGQSATVVLLPAFDEVAIMRGIADERATETFLVPTMLKRLIDHPRFGEFDLSSLRSVLYGAAPIDEGLLNQALSVMPSAGFVQFYGMTELSPVITALPASCHLPVGDKGTPACLRSAGRPIPTAEVAVIDSDGRPLPAGQVGEIVARGPMVMQGYWGQPQLSAHTLRDGWMHTGDLGRFDDDGFLYVVDRLKDMIITGGENVYSAEVENVLLLMPDIAACAVVGVPDAMWGERVHAALVLKPGRVVGADQVIAHCRDRLAGYKCPRSVEFRDALPLSAAGKLLKYEVRASARATPEGRTR